MEDCNSSNCNYWYGTNGWQAWCSQDSENCAESSNITSDYATALTKKNGIAMTTSLVNHASHTHYAAKAVRSYKVSHPRGTSDWFLPGVGQWNLIYKSMGGVNTDIPPSPYNANNDRSKAINAKIAAAGGTTIGGATFHSSTEHGAAVSRLWGVNLYLEVTGWNDKKGEGMCDRPVLAF